MAGIKSKRKYKRMAKSDRRNQKLWAEGCREGILLPHLGPYTDALAHSIAAERDYLARICAEYNQLIYWRLGDDEEPPLPMPKYDPKHIDDEVLTPEEETQKGKILSSKKHVGIPFSRITFYISSPLYIGNSSLAQISCSQAL